MILPTPLAITAAGTGLIVGAGLVFFFLKQIKLALIMGIAGGFLLACAGVAYGYVAQGKAEVRAELQPQLDAKIAQLAQIQDEYEKFQVAAVRFHDHAVNELKAKEAQLTQQAKTFEEKLNAQPPEVANVVVPAAAGVLLNSHIAETNTTVFGPDAGREAAAAAAAAIDSTVRSWEVWSGQVIDQYGKCASQVLGLQDYVGQITAAAKGKSE